MPTASPNRLTLKQEKFCLAYLETGNASRAYRDAYDVGDQTKPSTIWCSASQLLRKPSVAQRIDALRERHAERTGVTIDTVTTSLQQAYEAAMANGQPSAAVRACMALARLHGLFRSRTEVEARSFVVSSEPMTEEEWERKHGQPADQQSREIVECETA